MSALFPASRREWHAALDRGHRDCDVGSCTACALYVAWEENEGAELEELHERMLDSLGIPSGELLDALTDQTARGGHVITQKPSTPTDRQNDTTKATGSDGQAVIYGVARSHQDVSFFASQRGHSLLSVRDARQLAAQLIDAADKAEAAITASMSTPAFA